MWTVPSWTEETFQSGEAGFSLLFRNSGLGGQPATSSLPSLMTAGKLPQGRGEGGYLGVFLGPRDTTNHIKNTLPYVVSNVSSGESGLASAAHSSGPTADTEVELNCFQPVCLLGDNLV